MNPVIDPSWVYWIGVIGNAKVAFIIFSIILCIVAIVFAITCCDELFSEGTASRKAKKIFAISILLFLLSTTCSAFIPSQDTMIAMQVAKVATYDNVALTVDSLKDAVDYVVNAIAQIRRGIS